MNELDRQKVMSAGFTLYRCSEVERVIKRRTAADISWKIESRHSTKKTIKARHLELLRDPKAIQD